MRRLSLAIVLAAGLGAPGLAAWAAEETPPAPPPSQAEPVVAAAGLDRNDPNRIVCTREHVVGSNRPQKVCMTAAQRDALRKGDRDRRPTTGAPAPGPAPQ